MNARFNKKENGIEIYGLEMLPCVLPIKRAERLLSGLQDAIVRAKGDKKNNQDPLLVDLPMTLRLMGCIYNMYLDKKASRGYTYVAKLPQTHWVHWHISDIAKLKKIDILQVRGMGVNTLKEITDIVCQYGYEFAKE